MQKSRKSQHTSIGLSHGMLGLARAATRQFNALAADRELAERASGMAALPRQRLTEVRALYTLHAPPANTRMVATAPRGNGVLTQSVFEPITSQQEA